MNKYLKALAISLLLLLYSLASLSILALLPGQVGKRRMLARSTSFFARRALGILGVQVTSRRIARKGVGRKRRNYLVLSNHVSYVDILVLASAMPSVFITSIELKNTFPLGLLARFGGCIFVERRSPAGLRREIEGIASVLGQGISVVLFPESTTSNGETVRPFKSALLTAAIETGTDLLPVCLRYTRINGRPLDRTNRDAVFYHGGMSFFRHLPRFLSLRSVSVERLMQRPVPAFQRRTRRDLASLSHQIICSAYHGKHPVDRPQ